MKKVYAYTTIKCSDGSYISSIPELPGVFTKAESKEELIIKTKQAIIDCLKNNETSSNDDAFQLIEVNQIDIFKD